jgi:DNA-binding NtrC family response regulator
MREELFESFPFGIVRLNSKGEITRINHFAKTIIQTIDSESLEMLLQHVLENSRTTTWSVADYQVLYHVRTFEVNGDSNRLLLMGLEPNFSDNLPDYFERTLEDLTTNPQDIVIRIVSMVREATTFERFDLVRVNPRLRKYSYAYSIGINIEGSLNAPYSTIRRSGLGHVLETEAPLLGQLSSSKDFLFIEDPLLYQTGFRSALRVPILFDQGVVGAILLGSFQPLNFEIEDAFLLNQISDLVGQAFYHSGIMQEHSFQAMATSAFLQSAFSNLNGEHLIDFLTDYCHQLRLTSQLDHITLFMLDENLHKRQCLLEVGEYPLFDHDLIPISTDIEEVIRIRSIVLYNLADSSDKNVAYLLGKGFTSALYAPILCNEKVIAVLSALAVDEKALSPLTAGLFNVASEQLSPLITRLLPQAPNATPKAHRANETIPTGFSRIIGSSKIMQGTIQNAARAAQYEFPVLITGETGTGKELFAKALHQSSQVAQGPFIVVNSAAIPANLLESELFGYQEGAFTGGLKGGKKGKILMADGGTLFLDEIGELSPELQAKLLRVIQEQEIEPLGATKPIPIKVRIISATHRNLTQMVKQGEFREDLLYRLNSIELKIPPLRERENDIIELAEHMLQFLSQSYGTALKTLSASAKESLLKYSWPGNIRELQNIINRLYVFVEDAIIQSKDLPPDLRVTETKKSRSEREEIETLLLEFDGNKTALAHYLGITRTGLWKKLKRLGLQ